MKLSVFVIALLWMVMVLNTEETKAVTTRGWFDKLTSLWDKGEVKFLDHNCRFSTKPTIRKWQLYFKGKFWCPSWVPFSGSSRQKSQSKAVEKATLEFIRKGLEENVFEEKEVEIWLGNL